MPEPSRWSPAHRFTPKDYQAYVDAPGWVKDSPEFDCPGGDDKQRLHWVSTLTSWVQQAKNDQSKWKNRCEQTQSDLEELDDSGSVYSIEKTLAYSPLALAFAHVQESTAMLTINPPQGQVIATQEGQNEYVACANTLIDGEYKANSFDQVLCDAVYENRCFALSWIKTRVDHTQYGLFGQKGRIITERVDCSDMHVDPKAKRLTWQHMGYIIQESDHEIGEIRKQYPLAGFQVSDQAETSMYSSVMDARAQDNITSPLPQLGKGPATKRQQIKVYEAWFKDSRLKFVPKTEERDEIDGYEDVREIDPMTGEEIVTEEPIITTNPKALCLDEDGYVIGNWLPAYPNGRCIVIADQRILEDMPNRLPHGSAPFTPVPTTPAKKIFIPGVAVRIMLVVMKMNDLIGRCHAYLQSETERPMHAEFGSFVNAQQYKRVPNKSDKIVLLAQGKVGTFMRPPPIELPQSVWELLNRYQQYLDMIAGSSSVMRGTLTEGAQLSAEAVASLQSYASSRIAMEAKFLASAVKEVTRQVFWLIRATYDENVKVQVSMPDGSTQTIDWHSDKAIFDAGDEQAIDKLISEQSYTVGIKAGTGTPDAAASRQAVADHLFDRRAIDRPAYLDAYEYPNRQEINKRMDEDEINDIAAESMGRAVGSRILDIQKKQANPGRKEKY